MKKKPAMATSRPIVHATTSTCKGWREKRSAAKRYKSIKLQSDCRDVAAMSFKPFLKVRPARWVLYRLALSRVQEKLAEMDSYLDLADRVLDMGAGNCIFCQDLGRLGYNVVPVDLKNLSFVDAIVPVTYDGTTLPFDNDSFEAALVITVLHHAPDLDAVLAEVRRVARRIIVIEEIYENLVEKYFTYAIDSLFNFEFFSHPRSNRTDSEWRKTFQKLRLDISEAVYSRSLGLLRRVTYVLLLCCGRMTGPNLRYFGRPLRLPNV
jgi:SAM-dependent methyltransferase